jgi:hypothetical protein
MNEKKKLDMDNLTFVDEAQVPVKRVRYTPYRDILKRIKKGRALVISEDQVKIDTFRSGVLRLQKKGEFKSYYTRAHTGTDGKRRLYIVNPSETTPEEQEKKVSH